MVGRRVATLLALLLALPASAQFCQRTDGTCYAWTPGTISGPCNAPNAVVASCDGVTPTPTPVPTSPPTGAGFCQDIDGTCRAFGSIFGGACNAPSTIVLACPSAPTPTPTPTPTPVPLEAQPAYTVKEFLTPADVGKTYLQAMSLLNGEILVGNWGICCPPIGTPGQGEALFTIDYRTSPPTWHQWWETFSDSSELWETGCAQIAVSDMHPFEFSGCLSRRPAVEALKDNWKDGIAWGFGTAALDSPNWSFPWNLGIVANDVDTAYWPQAILDVDGQRWLVVQYMMRTGGFGLAKLLWPNAGRTAMWVPTSLLNTDPSLPMFSGIAVDVDGSWIACSGWWPSQTNSVVVVWRSRDAGHTWRSTGVKFEYPGHDVFGCGWSHTGHGAATIPWRLTCTSATNGSGPTDGSWHAVTIAIEGADPIPNLGQKPVKYTPAATPHGP